MVYRDVTRSNHSDDPRKDGGAKLSNLAAPGDRLAAAIIDISVILAPLVLLVSSPFQLLFVRSLLLNQEVEFLLSVTAIATVVLILTVSYMTMMNSLVGGTLGKLVFGLRVLGIWDQKKLSVPAAFFRSLTWLLSLAFALLPFLAVLSDNKRRPWHDRIADSIVVSVNKANFGSPNVFEKMFVQSVLGSVAALVLVSSMAIGPTVWNGILDSGLLPFGDSKFASYCDEVDYAMDEWPRVETVSEEKRLNIVLTLFAAGEVSKSCLEKEAQKFIDVKSSENATAYLAQAFVHSENPELSNQYLSKVCDLSPESSSCTMSKVVEDWSDSKWSSVEAHFASFVEHTPLHISVWALRHFIERREFAKAEDFLNKLASQPSLANFLAQQRVRILAGTGRDRELNAVAVTAIESLSSEGRLRVAEKMCDFHSKADSCAGTKSQPCQLLKKESLGDHSILVSAGTAIQVARVIACEDDEEDYKKLLALLPMQESHDYAVAVKAKLEGRVNEARGEFERLARLPDVSSKMRKQVEVELLLLLESADELYASVEDWRQEEPDLDWGVRGEALLENATRSGDYDQAMKIAELLIDERFRKTSILRPYVYSLLQSKKMKEAQTLLQSEWGVAQLVDAGKSPRRGLASELPGQSDLDTLMEKLMKHYRSGVAL